MQIIQCRTIITLLLDSIIRNLVTNHVYIPKMCVCAWRMLYSLFIGELPRLVDGDQPYTNISKLTLSLPVKLKVLNIWEEWTLVYSELLLIWIVNFPICIFFFLFSLHLSLSPTCIKDHTVPRTLAWAGQIPLGSSSLNAMPSALFLFDPRLIASRLISALKRALWQNQATWMPTSSKKPYCKWWEIRRVQSA